MTALEAIGTDASYITKEDTLTALSGIDADFLPAMKAACEEIGQSDPGIDCHVAKTHETLEDYEDSRRNHWHECNRYDDFEAAGMKAKSYYGVQIAKGHQRLDLVVIDCGEYRVVLTF